MEKCDEVEIIHLRSLAKGLAGEVRFGCTEFIWRELRCSGGTELHTSELN